MVNVSKILTIDTKWLEHKGEVICCDLKTDLCFRFTSKRHTSSYVLEALNFQHSIIIALLTVQLLFTILRRECYQCESNVATSCFDNFFSGPVMIFFSKWLHFSVGACYYDTQLYCTKRALRHKEMWALSCIENFCMFTRSVKYQVLSLRWRHNGHGGVSNHQPHNCLLNRLFECRLKKASKLRVTGLCAGHSAQMTSNAENVSIWWRHHIPSIRKWIAWINSIIRTSAFWLTVALSTLDIGRCMS